MDDLERMREIIEANSGTKEKNKIHYGKFPYNLKNWMDMMGCFGDMFFDAKVNLIDIGDNIF